MKLFSKSAGMPDAHLESLAIVFDAHKGILPTDSKRIVYIVPIIERGMPIMARILPVLAFLMFLTISLLLDLWIARPEKIIPANGIKDKRMDSKPKMKIRFAVCAGSEMTTGGSADWHLGQAVSSPVTFVPHFLQNLDLIICCSL